MIKDLDLTLFEMLTNEATLDGVLKQAEISFAVPDEEWRNSSGSDYNLNVYLYDIRENLELRSNERKLTSNGNGTVTLTMSPPRIDCAYIITAWNKATVTGDEDKELDEHRLLSEVLAVLFKNPRIPSGYLQGSLVEQEPDLPVLSAQKGGLPEPVEFWSALGAPLKPSINCVITISLIPAKTIEAPETQSFAADFEISDQPFNR